MSPRLVLSAFHCADIAETGDVCKTGTAILGAHDIDFWQQHKYYTIKVVDVLFPNEPGSE